MNSSTKHQPLTLKEQAAVAYYARNPLAFVREELGGTPSPDQEKLIMQQADMTKKNFIICAGRGSGKTQAVSWIASWSAAILTHFYDKYNISVLGGSKEQSSKLYDYVRADVYKTPLLEKRLLAEPLKGFTDFVGCKLQTHAASEKSVRGTHVELLILDEVCEIDDDILDSAMGMVSGVSQDRVIMLSTPHKFEGRFQEMWETSKEMNFVRHGPWPLTACHWQNQDRLKWYKDFYSPEKYKVEILGEFVAIGDKMFERDWIDQAVAAEPFGIDDRYYVDFGLDWGARESLTALVPVQRYKTPAYDEEKFFIPGPERTWMGNNWTRISDDIAELSKMHRVHTIYEDDFGAPMAHYLKEHHLVNVEDVNFTNLHKLMKANLQRLLLRNKLVISPDNYTLIEQLKKYKAEWIRKRQGKKDEDLVDGLMLACKQFADEDLEHELTQAKRFADTFHLV